MGRNRNLLAKLDAHKGRDIAAEKKRKEVKAADKRKREKAAQLTREAALIADDGDVEGVDAAVDDFATFDGEEETPSQNGQEDSGASGSEGGVALDNGDDDLDEDEEDEEDEDEDEDEEGSDVPLSELSEEDRADTIPHQRLTINNTAALLTSTSRVRIAHPSHKFSVHNSLVSSIPTNIPDPNDDLTRELEFYKVCQDAAQRARTLLHKEKVPFTRPDDYFAEMVKSDEHMGRIKQKLYDEAARKKASSEAKKQRQLKKFGKQVQVAKEQERAKEKRATLEKINELKRKRRGNDTGKVTEDDDLFDIGVEDTAGADDRPRKRRREQGAGASGGPRGGPKSKLSRDKRDSKFGFGGKKRFSKSGDALSSADLRAFSTKKMKGKTNGAGGGAGKRLGKSRRAAAAGR